MNTGKMFLVAACAAFVGIAFLLAGCAARQIDSESYELGKRIGRIEGMAQCLRSQFRTPCPYDTEPNFYFIPNDNTLPYKGD